VGQDDALDTREYFVVIPGMFGNGLSSSPTNTPPPFDRARFPHHTIQDNVRAQHRLLVERFDVQGIQLVIGGSMGAFQSFQWALSHPELVQRIMPCCGASRVSPHCYVFLEGVKAALLADAAYAGGDYATPPEAGLRVVGRIFAGWALSQAFYRQALYRQMGHDSVDDFLERFWEAAYLDVDANNLLSQLHTWQAADLAATRGYDGDHVKALGDVGRRPSSARAKRNSTSPRRTWHGKPSRCRTPSCARSPARGDTSRTWALIRTAWTRCAGTPARCWRSRDELGYLSWLA
jgi:homoserine O-acetyltransferase/O-succinyltransferase